MNYELRSNSCHLPPATCHIFIHLLVHRRCVVSPVEGAVFQISHLTKNRQKQQAASGGFVILQWLKRKMAL